MNNNTLSAPFLSLLMTACGMTAEKDPSPEVVDKSEASGMADVETDAGPTVFVPDDERPPFREELDDPESCLFERFSRTVSFSRVQIVEFNLMRRHEPASS